MNRTVGFLGVFLGTYVGPILFLKTRVMYWTLFTYVGLTYLSFLMAVIYCLIEHRVEKTVKIKEDELVKEKKRIIEELEIREGKDFASTIIQSVHQELDRSTSQDTDAETDDDEEDQDDEKNAPFEVKDVKSFSLKFWITATAFALGSQCYIQFVAFSTDCLVNRYGYTFEEAKDIVSVLPITALFFGPVISTIITKLG